MPTCFKPRALALAVCCAFTGAAQAQDQTLREVDVRSERAQSFRSQTVQVGTFRDVDQIDVPLTTNVVTRQVLDAQGATTLFDALRNTAGVTRAQLNGATYDNLAIRGILVENRANYRLNGSLPVINLIEQPLENKERIEVLKGASSLYYGFVPPSGIVNMVTKRAGAVPVTDANFSFNQFGGWNLHADVGRRFGADDRFGLRVNAAGGDVDIGVDNFSGDRAMGAAAFDWRLTRDLSFKLDVEHIRKDVSEPAAIALLPAVNGRIPLPPVPPNTRNLAGEWQKYDADATNILGRVDYAINDRWGVILEAGRAETNRDRNFSQFQNYNLATGAGALRIFFQRGQEYVNENYRGEVYGSFATGPLRHDVSFGYTANERFQDSLNAPFVDVPQNLYNPGQIQQRNPTAAFVSNPSTIDDRGLYLFDRISIGDHWQVMAGARWSDYESRSATTQFETDKVVPQYAVMWKPQPWISVYGSYLEGLEESGTAPANRANAGEILPPALSKQYEAGVKAEVARGVLVQGAYFNVERPSTFVDAQNRFTLNGLAEYDGFEFAASGEITRDVSLIGSAIFMDARQKNQANAATFDKVPENTARQTFSLFADWRVPALPGFAVNGGLFYTGKRFVDNANQGEIPGYTIGSVGARYRTKLGSRAVTFQANVDNVTDKDYWSTAGNGLLGVGLPRTFRFAMRVEI
jgi:iron complex outermembrane receptor protein